MASSPQRTAANRENARSSTGPRSGEGKARSSRNGITHGLTSTAILLDDEDAAEYETLIASVLVDLNPLSERERLLAVQVGNAMWRRNRIYRAEAAYINVRARAIRAEHPEVQSSDEAMAYLLTDPVDQTRTRLLLRYLTLAERACNRAVADFYELRHEQLRQAVEMIKLDEATMPTMKDLEQQFVLPKLTKAAAAGESMPVSPEPAPGCAFRYSMPFTPSPGPEQPVGKSIAFGVSPLEVSK